MDAKPAQIKFSDTPGCRERHLMRKHNNPLFPRDKSSISQSEVESARKEDLDEYRQFLKNFDELLLEISQLQGSVETEIILKLKERIDRMYDLCAGFGNDNSKYKDALSKLHDTIMKTIRLGAQNDNLALSELNKEQEARNLHLQLVEYKLVCDLIRVDSPIEENELVPSLLTEGPEVVQVVMALFDSQQQNAIREQAKQLIQTISPDTEMPGNIKSAYDAMRSQKQ